MGSDVGQIFPTASLHRDHSISNALVCEKEISYISWQPILHWQRWEKNRIHHWCSVGTEKSQPEGPPFQWETRLAEFPTERWTRGLGFFWNHWTPMIDSFSHIPRPYGTVLCNSCWWRHWNRCLQSMTRAGQVNMKQRINSALNNEQMVISLKCIYKN